jgi:hypothetical protein
VRYGPQDAFVTELNPNSSTPLYSTYIGGQTNDTGQAISVIAPGKVYVAINTQSFDFPLSGFSYKSGIGGAVDMALCQMDLTQSGLASLVYATFFGGSDLDEVRAMTTDAKGNMVITGYTLSTDFPVTGDAIQSANHGNGDAFVSVLNPSVPGFVIYSTYLGGNDGDVGYAVATDKSGSIYVTGYTMSGDFPIANAITPNWAQGIEIFVTKLKPGQPGSAGLQYSTYVGDANINVGYAIAVGPDGTTYVAGSTEGVLPIWPNPFQGSYGGGASDGFILAIGN